VSKDQTFGSSRASNKTLFYFKRFQSFIGIFMAIAGVEAFAIVAIELITRPHGFSLYFIIPISALALTLVLLIILGIYFLIPVIRAVIEERRLRKQGLPVDSTDPGPWLNQ